MTGDDGRGGLLGWYLPTGRIRRSEWWLRYVLLIALLGLMASVIDAQWFPDSYPRFEDREGVVDVADVLWFFPDQGGPVTALVALALIVPNIAATVTRLHDRDHSAWWLLWSLLPGIGWLVLVITCGFLGTRPHPNRYGPPPR
ncbi:DUF805 domain-containing protein [Modestobacter marinus]|uniref:DUF805 domain-containing protein n=1 Tax=Modestobacter marinus TaxID=477641 RepID=A0A846LJE0_9ACTN|nr:DUF805 domain-containing protein [Modestobacter marinus]NIH67657.1 uncharacterized membrane protein YhaH (DUF805 family) [Modestobacter marinus]GGL72376.1 DUF805 domain-containing protein [Modestobacter marinus]